MLDDDYVDMTITYSDTSYKQHRRQSTIVSVLDFILVSIQSILAVS